MFQGTIEVQAEGRTLRGELAFHRAGKNLQWTVRGAQTIALARLADGKVSVFENGVPRAAPSASELRDLGTIAGLVELERGPATEVTTTPDGYRVRSRGVEAAVRLIETIAAHGVR